MDRHTQLIEDLNKKILKMKDGIGINKVIFSVSLAFTAYSGMTTYGWALLVVSLYFAVELIMRVIELFTAEHLLQFYVEMAEWQSYIKLNNKIS